MFRKAVCVKGVSICPLRSNDKLKLLHTLENFEVMQVFIFCIGIKFDFVHWQILWCYSSVESFKAF